MEFSQVRCSALQCFSLTQGFMGVAANFIDVCKICEAIKYTSCPFLLVAGVLHLPALQHLYVCVYIHTAMLNKA